MKLMEKMRQKKLGNKGFSLVELIIVIAIMAILLGIVGTQVIPYLNRARESKDQQIINSYCTAAVTIYSTNAEDFAVPETSGLSIGYNMYLTDRPTGTAEKISTYYSNFESEIIELVGYTTIADLKGAMVSKKGQSIDTVAIIINFNTGIISAQAMSNGSPVFNAVESSVGTTYVAP